MTRPGAVLTEAGSHFDLDANPRIDETGGDHGRRGLDVTEVLPQHRPAVAKLGRLWHDIGHAHDVGQRRVGLRQRRLDVSQALVGLRDDPVRDRHRLVVEAGGA
jgi:hypothetical protein